jgi:hypothetical protein
VAGAAVVVLVVVTIVVLRALAPSSPDPGVAVPDGTLVLDAVPWAEVVEIADADGATVDLPRDPFTPLRLSLPAGRYRISLRRPGNADPVTVEAAVTAGETERRLERFDTLDADAFLRKYGL